MKKKGNNCLDLLINYYVLRTAVIILLAQLLFLTNNLAGQSDSLSIKAIEMEYKSLGNYSRLSLTLVEILETNLFNESFKTYIFKKDTTFHYIMSLNDYADYLGVKAKTKYNRTIKNHLVIGKEYCLELYKAKALYYVCKGQIHPLMLGYSILKENGASREYSIELGNFWFVTNLESKRFTCIKCK